jgi:peptidase YpeB-like protein
MRSSERVIGITIGVLVLAAAPAPAAPAGRAVIPWSTADAVAARRVAGEIVATRLADEAGRAVYHVDVQTPGNRLEEVRVDAHDARVLGVHEVTDPGLVGEIEAPRSPARAASGARAVKS